MNYIFIRVLLGAVVGWFMGFLMARYYLKDKYNKKYSPESNGILKVAYDQDDPDHPAMGLEINSLGCVLTNDKIVLDVAKIGFPTNTDKPVYLQSPKNDKSA